MTVVRDAIAGAVLGGAGERQHELEAADAAIRAPLALSRRIAVVHLAGGVGASTATAAVAGIIARRRGSVVLAVDAAAGTRSLRWHLSAGGGAARATPVRPRTQEEALEGLPRTATGAAVLDVHAPEDVLAVSEGAWAAQVAPLVRFCPVVVTDWGVRGADADLGGIAAASDVVCVVARADRNALERALSAALGAATLPNRPAVVVAAVDVGRTGGRLPRGFGRDSGAPIVRVPFERARRADGPVGGAACSTATRTALVRLAAAVMTERGA